MSPCTSPTSPTKPFFASPVSASKVIDLQAMLEPECPQIEPKSCNHSSTESSSFPNTNITVQIPDINCSLVAQSSSETPTAISQNPILKRNITESKDLTSKDGPVAFDTNDLPSIPPQPETMDYEPTEANIIYSATPIDQTNSHPSTNLDQFPGKLRPFNTLTTRLWKKGIAYHTPQARQQGILNAYLDFLRTPIMPLISVTTNTAHPDFPTSLLQFNLLTHAQLDRLAVYYHQVEPAVLESFCYPVWIVPWVGTGERVRFATKRARWAWFMGLRNGLDMEEQEGGEESVCVSMERRWRDALRRAQEEKILREKGWRERW